MFATEGRSESGITLIEVVISAMLVGIIAVATFTGFETSGRASADERTHNQATLIAAQDQERARSLAVTKLTQIGSETYTVGEGGLPCKEHPKACEKGTVYTVETNARYVTAAAAEAKEKEEDTLTCSTTEGEANFIKTTTLVKWSEASGEKKIEQSSVLSVPTSSALEVRVFNQAKEPVQGATVTAEGTTTNLSQTTDGTGCVVFGSIKDNTVETDASKSGFVGPEGKTPAPKPVTPSSKSLKAQEFSLAAPGAINATFTTNGTTTTGVTGDTVYLSQAGVGTPSNFIAGTAGTFASSVTQKGLYPFVSGAYTVYAGDCEKNNPESVASVKAPSAQVEPNQTASVKVEVPMVNLKVMSGTSASPGSLLTATSAKLINTECKSKSAQNYATTVPYEHVIKVISGRLEPRYAPYAKSLELCVAFGPESGKYYRYKASFANNLKAGTTETTIYAKTTGTGLSSATTAYTC
ncbi:MAG TPA: type II secretion system protein [Solirubrobacteraceae bacterium]|nr:type II secretion system protein [Solirubrobacteraceae bacterium]